MNLHRFALVAVLAAMPVLANAGWMPVITAVPTLSELGLIGLAAGVGGFGAWLISRKK